MTGKGQPGKLAGQIAAGISGQVSQEFFRRVRPIAYSGSQPTA
jgi:hypothetical protein